MKNREVFCSGIITGDTIAKLREEVSAFFEKDEKEPITLYISSGGGSAMQAVGFYEWVKMKNIPLTTIALVEVSSAAITIFLSGQTRYATKHSWFLIHPAGSIKDTVRQFSRRFISPRRYREERDWDNRYQKVMADILAENTKIPLKDIRRSLSHSFLSFNPSEAKELGLVEKII